MPKRLDKRDSCLVPFRNSATITLAAGTNSFACAPVAVLSPTAANEADSWAQYRVKRLRFRLLPDASQTIRADMGFCPGNQDTLPSTVGAIGVLINHVVLPVRQTIPTEWCTVNPKDLAGALPWYKTVPGTAAVDFENPGFIVFAGDATVVLTFQVEGVFEFKGAVYSANTPAQVALRKTIKEEALRSEMLSEKKRLIQVLAVTEPTGNRTTP